MASTMKNDKEPQYHVAREVATFRAYGQRWTIESRGTGKYAVCSASEVVTIFHSDSTDPNTLISLAHRSL